RQANIPCEYKLKGRQADCEKDRAYKAEMAKKRQDAADSYGFQINALTLENADLYDQAATSRTVEESLAKMGTTAEAEAIKAIAEAETKKDNNTLFIVIAVLAALGIGIFVYKKFF
ncbi:hypothetical protein, partial [Lishizhenia sp.]|uniref:hypothetical protein n=1 Tax=Lishizhenia sp. TaxID=2497594 RepID=UPI00299D58C2